MQREGVNFNQTTAPTPAAAFVKTVSAVANQMGLTIYHLDVKQAYTTARLDSKIVMKLLGGCGELSGKYVDLEKALYGLKQSGLLWNDLLVETLVTVHGTEHCMTDPCVFRLTREGEVVMILTVHLDDVAVAVTGVEVDNAQHILYDE